MEHNTALAILGLAGAFWAAMGAIANSDGDLSKRGKVIWLTGIVVLFAPVFFHVYVKAVMG